ncbi:OB-fold nucleic acid binding domain-containing protein [Paracoccus sp. (in: a-proteobacteria)]|uniref:helix-hairpin-helix domain-containing protein n=1 Tax=Paracoccus sp. TaxID=267 RepID=UPI0035B2A9A5
MIKGLANAHAAAIVAARADQPFTSIEDLWRRVRVPIASLTRIAEADGFRPGLGLSRRGALWVLKGLGAEDLPLFAASREASARQEEENAVEAQEPVIALRPMTLGREVVEDYGHTGLSLRRHPVSFLRETLQQRRMVTCAEAMTSRDCRWCAMAGLVLVRQRPGSAKGVMFITLEDETGVANLVVWAKVFEAHRRIVLGADMIGVQGRIQREGEVVHFVVHRIEDLSRQLASVGVRGAAFPLRQGCGDEARQGAPAGDLGDGTPQRPRPREIYIRDLSLDAIRVKARNFQ